jgi:CheY-like chemotaxis protein
MEAPPLIPAPSAKTPPSVLIVDQSAESREVLRTVLERRGVRILEASGARQGLDLVRRCRPRVIVVDLESEADGEQAVRQEYGAASVAHDASLVMLCSSPGRPPQRSGLHMVAKPYHYAPLIRTIEQLLQPSIGAERGE